MQSADPKISDVLQFLKKGDEEALKQNFDSWRMFKPEPGFQFDSTSLFHFHQYPTAQLYMKALCFFENGSAILKSFQKENVETLSDCALLQPAFRDFVYGHVCENSLFPKEVRIDASPYVDQYLKLKPDDFIVEYLQFLILWRSSSPSKRSSQFSDYERNKLVIRTGEKLADKLKSSTSTSPDLQAVRIDLYYVLGTRYSATNQYVRALDSFEKCYRLDNNNYHALYGVAYHYMNKDSQKAKSLFNEYLQIAPKCEKQYPNALYMLASISLKEQNCAEVFRYQEMAEKAEKERLPFLEPVSLPQKDAVQLLKKYKNQLKTPGGTPWNVVDVSLD